jgi:hypothetical protein
MLGLRSFNLGSQYLSENVTSDSDTCPSASHALIICASKLISWKIQSRNLSIATRTSTSTMSELH